MSALLPSGSRALAITIDNRGANSAGGFILPNDRVDVIRIFRDEAASKAQGARRLRQRDAAAQRPRAGDRPEHPGAQRREGRGRRDRDPRARSAPGRNRLCSRSGSGQLSLALRSLQDISTRPTTRSRGAKTTVSPSCATAPRHSADADSRARSGKRRHDLLHSAATARTGRFDRPIAIRCRASPLACARDRPHAGRGADARHPRASSSVTAARDAGQPRRIDLGHRQVGHRRPAARRQGSLRRQPEGGQRHRPLDAQDLRHRPGRRADQRRRAWTPRAARSPTSTSTSAATSTCSAAPSRPPCRPAPINVVPVGDTIVLTGAVALRRRRAAGHGHRQGLRRRPAPSARRRSPGTVVNSLTVRGKDQVMLKVTVAEIQRVVLKQLGINTAATWQLGTARPAPSASTFPLSLQRLVISETVARVGLGNSTNVTLRPPSAPACMRTLAEPTLTAISGESAQVHGGRRDPGSLGRDPAPPTCFGQHLRRQRRPTSHIGVALNFTPIVLSEGRISLHVSTEVTDIDYENQLRSARLERPGLQDPQAWTPPSSCRPAPRSSRPASCSTERPGDQRRSRPDERADPRRAVPLARLPAPARRNCSSSSRPTSPRRLEPRRRRPAR